MSSKLGAVGARPRHEAGMFLGGQVGSGGAAPPETVFSPNLWFGTNTFLKLRRNWNVTLMNHRMV